MTEREEMCREEGMSDFSQEIEPAVTPTVHAGFGYRFPDSGFDTCLFPISLLLRGHKGAELPNKNARASFSEKQATQTSRPIARGRLTRGLLQLFIAGLFWADQTMAKCGLGLRWKRAPVLCWCPLSLRAHLDKGSLNSRERPLL